MTRDEIYRKAGANLLALADGKDLIGEEGAAFANASPIYSQAIDGLGRMSIKPEPVLRPWTEAEIEAECVKGTVLKCNVGPTANIGSMALVGGEVFIGPSCKCRVNRGQFILENYVIAATGAHCGVME